MVGPPLYISLAVVVRQHVLARRVRPLVQLLSDSVTSSPGWDQAGARLDASSRPATSAISVLKLYSRVKVKIFHTAWEGKI